MTGRYPSALIERAGNQLGTLMTKYITFTIKFQQRTRYVLARLCDSDKIGCFPYQILGICISTPSSELMHAIAVALPWHLIRC